MGYLTDGAARVGVALERVAARTGPRLLRLSLGVVFVWFALPKFVPGLSALAPLGVDTIGVLSLGAITGDAARLLLATVEAGIGVGLLAGRALGLVSLALVGHLAGTFAPLVLFADRMWTAPFVPGLEGQFILKNIVLVAAAIAVAGAHRRRAAAVPAAGTATGQRREPVVVRQRSVAR